jgi:5-methylthioadenosine/S-adenosylhomocysteine deaminase
MALRVEMPSNRLRILGGTVLTLDARGTVYNPGEVLVESGRVSFVGSPGSRPPQPGETVIDARHGLILPGLVNAHCHSSDTLVRGTAPTLPLEAWSHYTEAGRAGRTPREIYLSAALTAIEALKTGTTTLLDHLRLSPGPDLEGFEAAARAYLDVGIRSVVAPVLADLPAAETLPLDLIELSPADQETMARPPTPWQAQAEVCEAFVAGWKSRIHVQVGPSAPHRCSDRLLERCGEIAAAHGVRLHTHFLETVPQALVATRRFPRGAAAHLADLGLLPNASLVHCVHADDVDTIAAAGAVVVHCPAANQRLASGVMPWHEFDARGVTIALGTDGVLCNDSLSMPSSMKLAGLIHTREPRPEAQAILRAATAAGARACGIAGIGRLEPGAKADVVVLGPSLSRDPYNRVVYEEEWRPVHAVLVDGRVIADGGRVTTMDEDALIEEAREASAALIDRNAERYRRAGNLAHPMRLLVARAQEVFTSIRSGQTPSGFFN